MNGFTEKAAYAWSADSVRLFATPSAFARTSLFYVQEIGHFRTRPGYFTERQRLESYLVVYTVRGAGKLDYGGRTWKLAPGRVFFIDCMDYQRYAAEADGEWELLWVHMNGPTLRGYYEQYRLCGDAVRALEPDSRIPDMLASLLEAHGSKSARTELLSSRLLSDLLTELLLTGSPFEAQAAAMPDYVAGAAAWIEARYGEKLSLGELAKRFSVSKYYLAKEFKRCTGYSPGEYVINTRITKAKELLKYTGDPIADIAERVGVGNVSHFINLFKDRAGQTPLAFRKQWQNPR